MSDEKKICPLKFGGQNFFAQNVNCESERCAWWCKWTESCALVAIAQQIEMNGRRGYE